jgi:hypothetical protein
VLLESMDHCRQYCLERDPRHTHYVLHTTCHFLQIHAGGLKPVFCL